MNVYYNYQLIFGIPAVCPMVPKLSQVLVNLLVFLVIIESLAQATIVLYRSSKVAVLIQHCVMSLLTTSLYFLPTFVMLSPSVVFVVFCLVIDEVGDILGQVETAGEVINMDEAVRRS